MQITNPTTQAVHRPPDQPTTRPTDQPTQTHDSYDLELAVIGGFLIDFYHPHPLKGVVGDMGLKSDHFVDQNHRAAFCALMAHESADPLALAEVVARTNGLEYAERAIAAGALEGETAEDRIARLAERGRRRDAVDALHRLICASECYHEDFLAAEIQRVGAELAAATPRAAARTLFCETLEEFVREAPPAPDPIIANCFERGDKVELIAPSKCRKSFWALDLALHVACGRPFCGLAVPKPRYVLLVNLEVKRDWMKRRVASRLRGYGISPSETAGHLAIMNCRGRGTNVRDAILGRVQDLHPDFVILDPRYKLMRPDEDENTGNGLIGVLNLLDSIAEAGAAVMIVSHDKKGDIKSQDIRDRGAGSNWAGRDVDCRFVMTPHKTEDDQLAVGLLTRNYPPRPAIDLRALPGRFVRVD